MGTLDGFGFPFSGKRKTSEELLEENERLKTQAENEDLQSKIALNQAERKRLENAGLTVRKDFGGSIKRAINWLNKTK